MDDHPEYPIVDPGHEGDGKQKSTSESLIEIVAIIAVALGLALGIQAFVVKPYKIPSESMVPTLEIGQRVLVNRIEGRFGTPARGDILVFNPPAGAGSSSCGIEPGQEYLPGHTYQANEFDPEAPRMACPRGTAGKLPEAFIKRVIGMPGDRLKVVKGNAYINGKRLNEPYLNPKNRCDQGRTFTSACTYSIEITIPPDTYFMMGDNRNASADSRIWGPVPKDSIIGKAFFTYWPLDRVGLL